MWEAQFFFGAAGGGRLKMVSKSGFEPIDRPLDEEVEGPAAPPLRTRDHGFRVAHSVVDLGGAFPGDAFAGGPVIHAIDLVARDGSLLVFVDHYQIVVCQFVHFDEKGLGGALLEYAQFGAGFELLQFGPGVVHAEGQESGAKEKNQVSAWTYPTASIYTMH